MLALWMTIGLCLGVLNVLVVMAIPGRFRDQLEGSVVRLIALPLLSLTFYAFLWPVGVLIFVIAFVTPFNRERR